MRTGRGGGGGGGGAGITKLVCDAGERRCTDCHQGQAQEAEKKVNGHDWDGSDDDDH